MSIESAPGANPATAEKGPELSTEAVFVEIGRDLDLLCRLHDRELDAEALDSLHGVDPQNWLGLPPAGEQAAGAFELMRDTCRQYALSTSRGHTGTGARAGGSAVQDPVVDTQALLNELAADYAGLYVTHSYRASPSESVWMTDDSLTYQEPMFEVRKWYKRYQLEVPNWRERSDDHLVFQLEFLARLIRIGSAESLLDAGRFLDQHLLNWIEDFATKASRNVQTPFYAGLVLLTSAYILALRTMLVELTGEERQKPKEKQPEEAVVKIYNQPYVPGLQPGW